MVCYNCSMIFWSLVFVASLLVMVKGADWMLAAAERIGLALGLSSFIVGVVLVGLGTSLPELITAIFAVAQNASEIVVGNAVGSNISNILLVVGISSAVGGQMSVTKSLIDLDIPLLAVSTLLVGGMLMDGVVTAPEAALLCIGYVIYFGYTIYHEHEDPEPEKSQASSDRSQRRKEEVTDTLPLGVDKEDSPDTVQLADVLLLVVGATGLFVGSKYLVESVTELARIFAVSAGVISLLAVSFGTSLPELIVSIKAVWRKQSAVALGNIFGSNVFNLLLVIGVPGLFSSLVVDAQTLSVGVPVLLAATFLFVISGISRRVHAWEGAMYVLFYLFFVGKLFAIM